MKSEALVRDLMICKFVKVSEDELLWKAIMKLSFDRELRCICVVDEEGKLKGLISPRVLLQRVQLDEQGTKLRDSWMNWSKVLKAITAQKVKEIMLPPFSVKPEQSIKDAIHVMLENYLYELPVVTDEMVVKGEVTFVDIMLRWAERARINQDQITDD